ncbi:MAG: putative methyltransferase [Dehalococcoidia bacterium]|nr:putative methyltransferase [Dehalococcoidia bacterium]
MTVDYSKVTENPGDMVTRRALQMVVTRYSLARQHCQDKDVLEIGCGPGLGLGYLAQGARRVVGGDYTAGMVRTAQRHYRGRFSILRLDAHALPFAGGSFDVAILFEAIYYLADPGKFLDECRRVLRKDGILIVCTVNREWPDFNPSPSSTTYYSAPELLALLTEHGFQTEMFGAFPASTDSLARKVVSLIRRTAVSLHLIPGSMKGKAWLKRLFYGRLTPLPAELSPEAAEGLSGEGALVHISEEAPASQYTVLYALGRLR